MLGLRDFQTVDEQQLTSYYQIAGQCPRRCPRRHHGPVNPPLSDLPFSASGIHGEPFKPWDNVQGLDNWDFGGYCTHSSVLFAPWHRPYLALYEVGALPPRRMDVVRVSPWPPR